MKVSTLYNDLLNSVLLEQKLLAILIDPEKFDTKETASFLRNLPKEVTHLFVGGSTVPEGMTDAVVRQLKLYTSKPIILFPGDYKQLTSAADGVLFLSLLSGDNPDYLIGQQRKSIPFLRAHTLEVIPTGYLLIEGGNASAVAKVTHTHPLDQQEIQTIVDTAKAGELMGAKLIYLEAGSGALYPVSPAIISAVKKDVNIPLIVGGGIKTEDQIKDAYTAGADIIVMGTAFEKRRIPKR